MPRPSAFAEHFDAIVWPQLAARIRVQGTLLSCGLTGYAEGHQAVVEHALRLGAAYLPGDGLDALLDRVDVALLAEIDRVDRIGDRLGALRARDPSAFWRFVWGFKRRQRPVNVAVICT
ncbi:MAG: hypothetical protein KGL39_24080 [Patescibacteria group bacterium]|nr:hypothetical protein [Patescibacteria group bacterium]